jgi:hypothetical protein
MRTSFAIFTLFATVSAQDCLDDNSDVDSYGDTCEWYTPKTADSCGNFDTETFSAAEFCCACAVDNLNCVSDMSATDSLWDDCTWYEQNPSGCGVYDDDDFVSANLCCACGGGLRCESEAEKLEYF